MVEIDIDDLIDSYTCDCGVVLNRSKFKMIREYSGIQYNFICPVCKKEIDFYISNNRY